MCSSSALPCLGCTTPEYRDGLTALNDVVNVYSLPGFVYPVLLLRRSTYGGHTVALATFTPDLQYAEHRVSERSRDCVLAQRNASEIDSSEPDVSEEPYDGPGADTHQRYGLVPVEVALPILQYGADTVDALRALPEPDSIRMVNAFMPQESGAARLITWFYEDAWLVFAPDSGLVGVGILGAEIATGHGVRVGDTSSRLTQQGLARHDLADGQWDLASAALDGRWMRVWIAGGRISRVYVGVLNPR